LAGAVAALLAGVAAWLARESPFFRGVIVVLAAISWAAPGPLIGFGINRSIQEVLDLETRWNGHALGYLLYTGPSLLPALWADIVRLWPFALALVWPAVRAIPREQLEAARVDGAGPVAEFKLAVFPAVRPALVRAGIVVAVLALGEVSASKIVATVRGQTLAHDIFAQMHYGVTPTVAAQCLLLFVIVVPLAMALGRRNRMTD
jgi:ABC-type spermidine/putrescine transport system permease subunit II